MIQYEALRTVELRIAWRHAFAQIRRGALERECPNCSYGRWMKGVIHGAKLEPSVCLHLRSRLKCAVAWLALGAGLRVACDGGSMWGYRWFWEEPRYPTQDVNAGSA